jgi:hypothetical protein
MPAGVDLQCRVCGYKRIATSWLEYGLDSGEMKGLEHQGESEDIKAFGVTMEEARDHRRLYQCAAWACAGCGRLCESRELVVAGRPFWRRSYTQIVLWVEIAGIVGLGAYEILVGLTESYVCPAMAAFGASIVLLAILEARAESVAWGNRWDLRPPPRCPSCECAELKSPTLERDEAFMCNECGKRELRVASSWIS